MLKSKEIFLKPRLSVAVRTLVAFVLQAGDLESTFAGTQRSLEGVRAHQRIQRARPAGYQSEVSVQHEMETPHFILTISGRIDGVFSDGGRVVVDEIKSTHRDLSKLEEAPNPVHWGQVKAYAWLLALQQGLTEVDVQLTYYHLTTEKTRELRQTTTMDALEGFMTDLLEDYIRWANRLEQWRRRRNRAIADLTFPFADFREGQRHMAVAVYRAIQSGGQAMIQAPTGIGKTMAALYPSVKALGEELTAKIFYLTARTTGRQAAERALEILRANGLRLKSLTLTAKEKICPHPEAACMPEECPRARGHYDRMKSARAAAFELDGLTRDTVARLAEGHTVCPFEFSLDMALWMDTIIGDYNYAFDPRVYLRRFFSDDSEAYTFLVDEAHNLVDRSREMFSAVLHKQPFLELRRALRDDNRPLYRAMGRINSWMVSARRDCLAAGGEAATPLLPDDLLPPLQSFHRRAEKWLVKNKPAPWKEDLLQRFFDVATFLRVAERFDSSYTTCTHSDGKDLQVKLFCLDPADQLAEALQRGRSAVFFSATLTPFAYFNELFGGDDETVFLRLPSPFPPENLCLIVEERISTYFRDREQTKHRLAEAIHHLVKGQPGNYLAFFPSYAYLAMVHDVFQTAYPEIPTIVQSRDMDEQARDVFLENFTGDNPGTLVGFVVMGGIFGEGIDLVGRRLSGAAIVGVGLPGIGMERDLIRDHFEAKLQAGFDFAYRYPGFNRVLQAVGRVIRTTRDRGSVLLVDSRFATRRYQNLFPNEWRPIRPRSGRPVASLLDTFWAARGPAFKEVPHGTDRADDTTG
jgi:DNA excision repair protein ERCC-2